MTIDLDQPLAKSPDWTLSLAIAGVVCPTRELSIADFTSLQKKEKEASREESIENALSLFPDENRRPSREKLADDDFRDRLTSTYTGYLLGFIEKKREAAREVGRAAATPERLTPGKP